AGADMILIHSKSQDPDEVLSFAKLWDRPKTPLVFVPTIYKKTKVDALHQPGFKLIIMANHDMRSSIKAITDTLRTLRSEQYAASADENVVPLKRVYEPDGVEKRRKKGKPFFPSGSPGVTAVSVAGGQSRGLLRLREELPKPMLDIKGKSILERQIEVLN